MIILRKVHSSGIEKDSTYEIIDSSNTAIAKTIVFNIEEAWNTLDFSTIYTEDIPRTVEAIIDYAKQCNKRVVEFPQIYLYEDGMYKCDKSFFDLKKDTAVEDESDSIDVSEDDEDDSDSSDCNSDDENVCTCDDCWSDDYGGECSGCVRIKDKNRKRIVDKLNQAYYNKIQQAYNKRIEQKRYLNAHPDTWGINGKIWKYLKEKYANVYTLKIDKDVDICSYNNSFPSELNSNAYSPVLCIPRTLNIKPKNLYDIRIDLYEERYWYERNDCVPIYSNQVKAAIVQGCNKFPEYHNDVGEGKCNVRQIMFPESLFINFKLKDNSSGYGDLYMAIYIHGNQLVKTDNEAANFRLNKLLRFSDASYEYVAHGYPNSIKNFMFIVNDLTFPEKSYYTKYAYSSLQQYVKKMSKPNVKEEFSFALVPCQCKPTLSMDDNCESSCELPSDESTCSEDTSSNLVSNTTKSRGYIYLIRKREHVRMKENVFKHGKTKIDKPTLFIPRFNGYDKGSELCYVRIVDVDKVDAIETKITQSFRRMFKKHSDGREYFIGNQSDMICKIEEVIEQYM